MPKTGQSRAQANRAIRQEALREQLKVQGHHQHASDIVNKLRDLDHEYTAVEISRLKIALDGHMRFVEHYLPKPKQIEITEGVDLSSIEDIDAEISALIAADES